jgi:hypothetical protein
MPVDAAWAGADFARREVAGCVDVIRVDFVGGNP